MLGLCKCPQTDSPTKRVNQSSEIVTWSHEVKVIFEECNMLQVLESNFPLNAKETVQEMKQAFFSKAVQISGT